MPAFSRIQLLVYGAVAVAVLLVGARWVRGADEGGEAKGAVAYAADASEGGGGDEGSFTVDAGGEDLVVHVSGAVRDPGVYRLPPGARVTDAVERAGGAEAGASADSVNLAATLADGQQIVIPGKVPGAPAGAAAAATSTDGPISLGSATLEQLDTIDGIGPVTAQSILDFRDENGGLSSVDDLDQVSGIGPTTMEALRGRLQP